MKKTIAITSIATLGALLLILGAMQIKSNEKVAREIEQEQVKEFKIEDAKRDYAMCLDNSYKAYSTNWDTHCEMLGKGSDCGLPTATSKNINEAHDKANDDCMELYKLELSNI